MKPVKSFIITGIVLFNFLSVSGQEDLSHLKEAEDSLHIYLDSLRASMRNDHRTKWNKLFKKKLAETLEEEGAFDYPFDSLKTMAKLYSPDKKFRLFNWNVENNQGEHSFYGFVLLAGKEKVIELIDQSNTITEPESKSLDNKKWYGALYYDIIHSSDVGRNEYTLLGWDGNNRQSGKMIIDVLVLAGDKVNFGAPIFINGQLGIKKRVVFEFSPLVNNFVLEYDEKEKRIVFDHLMPESPAAEGVHEYYFPDGSFDGYKLTEGKWIFESDVDARFMERKYNGKLYDPNKR
ncbi:MAG: hypothetical protein ACOZCO_17765 [Bacteroidota bacterium]